MYKLRLAKQGKSIYDSDKDQVFDTKFPCFVVVDEGIILGDQSAPNPLGVPTAFFAWNRNGWKPNSWTLNKGAYVSQSNGTFHPNSDPSKLCKYYLTQQKLNEAPCTVKPARELSPALATTDGNTDLRDATWDQIGFHSGKRTLQVWRNIDFVLSYNTDNKYYEGFIEHGFNFTPAFIAYAQNLTQYAMWSQAGICDYFGMDVYSAGRITHSYYFEACADTSKIYVRVQSGMEGMGFLDPALNGSRNEAVQARFKILVIGAIEES